MRRKSQLAALSALQRKTTRTRTQTKARPEQETRANKEHRKFGTREVSKAKQKAIRNEGLAETKA
jgi:hypothetical protein